MKGFGFAKGDDEDKEPEDVQSMLHKACLADFGLAFAMGYKVSHLRSLFPARSTHVKIGIEMGSISKSKPCKTIMLDPIAAQADTAPWQNFGAFQHRSNKSHTADPSCINPLHPWTIFSITRSIACCEFLQNCSLKQPECWVIHIQGRIGESRPRFECRAAPFGHLIKGSCMCCPTSDPIPILSSGMPLKKLLDMVEGFGRTSLHQGPNSRNQYNLI